MPNYVKSFFPQGSITPSVIRACGGNANRAVVLYILLFWVGKSNCWGHGLGWFYKTYKELELETGIKWKTIWKICEWMKTQGFLETKVKVVMPGKEKGKGITVTHFRIDFAKLRLFLKENGK